MAILLVVGWRRGVLMASGAVRVAFMVEPGGVPIISAMTAAALAFVMIDRGNGLVTVCAGGVAGMVEAEDVPIFNIGMAAHTGTFVMLHGRGLLVAAFAGHVFVVGYVFVVKGEDGPILHILVAEDTFAGIVGLGQESKFFDNGRVAGFAFSDIFMTVSENCPVVGVEVASLAGGAGIVGEGLSGELVDNGRVAGFAFDDIHMVKVGDEPIVYGVAAITGSGKMVGVEAVFGQHLMAVAAFGGGVDVFAGGMAGETVGFQMCPGEQVERMVYILSQEGDGGGSNDAGWRLVLIGNGRYLCMCIGGLQ